MRRIGGDSSFVNRPADILRILIVLLLIAFLYVIYWYTSGTLQQWLEPAPVLSVIGLIIGFILLSWQLDRQNLNTMEANRRQAQDKLRLEIYEEIAQRIEVAGKPIAELCNVPALFLVHLQQFRIRAHNEVPRSQYSFSYFSDLHNKVSDSVISLMFILEAYEIVMPEFSAFRERLSRELLSRPSNSA